MNQKELSDFESSGVECPTCGDEFDTKTGMKVHHATIHGESIAGIDTDCPNCGEAFNIFPWRLERSKDVFCSVSCEMEYHGGHAKEKTHPEIECEWCGSNFQVKPAREADAQFCSRECFGKYKSENHTGKNSASWDGGENEKDCEVCGQSFSYKSHREDTARFCSNDCRGVWLSEERSGQNSPHWRGGKSLYDAVKANLSKKSWEYVAAEERKKECNQCGDVANSHDVHHIIPIMCGGTNESWNLMTLCNSCHRKAELFIRQYDEFDPLLVE
jgi:5-methylcytosine-specific restriction endonuclease McrA